MKIFNGFSGIGGNRTLWGNEHEITACDTNEERLEIYHQRFPNDEIEEQDAYQYYEDHYQEFDLAWFSPPCPTHSKLRLMNQNKKLIPDMKLYGLIIFCQYFCPGKYVIENVQGYYNPLITPNSTISRHYWWTNIKIPFKEFPIPKQFNTKRTYIANNGKTFTRNRGHREMPLKQLYKFKQVDPILLQNYSGNKTKLLRDCVDPRVGKYILDCILGKPQGLSKFL